VDMSEDGPDAKKLKPEGDATMADGGGTSGGASGGDLALILNKLGSLDDIKITMRSVNAQLGAIQAKLDQHDHDLESLRKEIARVAGIAENAQKMAQGRSTAPPSEVGTSAGLSTCSSFPTIGGTFASAPAGLGKTMGPLSSRTCLVIGGFPQDTMRETIESVVREVAKGVDGVATTWAPSRRGSIGKVHFTSPDRMWDFVKARKGTKLHVHGGEYWFSVEKTADERAMARKVSKAVREFKAAMSGQDVNNKEILDADWTRGIVWVKNERIVVPSSADPKVLEVVPEVWTRLGVTLEATSFIAGVNAA